MVAHLVLSALPTMIIKDDDGSFSPSHYDTDDDDDGPVVLEGLSDVTNLELITNLQVVYNMIAPLLKLWLS